MGSFAYSCTSPLPAGEGNVSADPLFADADNGDFRLLAASPCRDKGSNSYAAEPTDLAGSPRILSGTVDMGAYEAQLAGAGTWKSSVASLMRS